MKNWGCSGLGCFRGVAGGLGCAKAFGGRAVAAPVVLPLAMVASRLSISRRHGTDLCCWLRLRGTCHA